VKYDGKPSHAAAGWHPDDDQAEARFRGPIDLAPLISDLDPAQQAAEEEHRRPVPGSPESRWPKCDKCGKPVRPHNNIYFVGVASGEIQGCGILLCRNRHFLPEEGCEGSPSRAQYIEGQPRDARGFAYLSECETKWRDALRLVRSTPESTLADGVLSEWLPVGTVPT
jgi:hypothetical protein